MIPLCLCLLLLLAASDAESRGDGPEKHAAVLRNLVVYESPAVYCAWPSIARARGGEVVVVFTRTEEHLSPDGAIVLTRSTDGGNTWSAPCVVRDSPIDDRESGLTELAGGKMLGHFWSTFHTGQSYERLAPGSYEGGVIDRWTQAVKAPRYRAAASSEGAWQALSEDGGRTWSDPVRGVDAVHGGIELREGGLLVASYRLHPDSIVIFGAEAPGGPWRTLSVMTSPDSTRLAFCEPHVAQLRNGRVVMMLRVVAKPYDDSDQRCVLWVTWSDDRGKTWESPRPTSLWGYPPHLLVLSDGRVLCTYGYRRPPYGERACISDDGIHWRLENELILRDDAPNGDLGYPASTELEPGKVLTVYYQPYVPRGTVQRMHPPDPGRTKPGILATIWRIPPRR